MRRIGRVGVERRGDLLLACGLRDELGLDAVCSVLEVWLLKIGDGHDVRVLGVDIRDVDARGLGQ